MTGAKVRLAVAAALFLGWMGWLGYAAWDKSHGPVVSKAQAAAGTHAIVAEVSGEGQPEAKATVVRPLTGNGPAAGTEIQVVNLPAARGYEGKKEYLLLLVPVPDREPNTFRVAGPQRSPGYELSESGPATIYPWTPDVKVQAERLFP